MYFALQNKVHFAQLSADIFAGLYSYTVLSIV